ncbi:MAG: AAA family ATPase [Nocardiopsaceae bacterium]|jgi:aminoglycoside phosphotransferase family enzyme/predicted kinase|nr:AAA family ATPase [Nocardiopsaceae bacterium]
MPPPDVGGAALQAGPGPGPAAVAETHSGIVFFAGDRAYKLKKHVDLGFLDYRSREARRLACHREVELNRRLAPDVYLGVADLLGPDGQPCDHLVVMRRLPAGRRLATLAAAGEPLGPDIRRVARVLATFHARAATSDRIGTAASRDALRSRWEANAGEMARFAGMLLDRVTAERVITLARRYLAGRGDLIAARVVGGCARDGHGDLLATDIFLLADGPRVLDCLEFDDALRWDDVLADVAFLAMDLERLGRADLAAEFLAAYREFSGGNWPDSLAHHHIAYRAQVRCKVAALAWEQAAEGSQRRTESARDARQLLELADRHLAAGRVRLVVIGGLPGTGKSTLAARVASALGAVLVRSDEVRKQLAGLDPGASAEAPFGQGLYRPEMTDATYTEVLRQARAALAGGQSVVADASWHHLRWRDEVRSLAGASTADLSEFRCVLPAEVIMERIRGRSGGPSDATADIVMRLAASQQPWPAAVEVDTMPSPDEVTAQVLAVVRSAG